MSGVKEVYTHVVIPQCFHGLEQWFPTFLHLWPLTRKLETLATPYYQQLDLYFVFAVVTDETQDIITTTSRCLMPRTLPLALYLSHVILCRSIRDGQWVTYASVCEPAHTHRRTYTRRISICKDILWFPECNVMMMSHTRESYHTFVEGSLGSQASPTFSASQWKLKDM